LFEIIFDVATEEQMLQLCDDDIITTLLLLISDAYLPSESLCSLLNILLVIYRLCPLDIDSDQYKQTMKLIDYHCSQPEKGILPNIDCDEIILNPHLYTRNEDEQEHIIFDYSPPSFDSRAYLYIFGFSFIHSLKLKYIDNEEIIDCIEMFSKYCPSTSTSSSSDHDVAPELHSNLNLNFSFSSSCETLLSSFNRITSIVPFDNNFQSGYLMIDTEQNEIGYFISYFNNISTYTARVLFHHFHLHGIDGQ
jgi:hypothetical protein